MARVGSVLRRLSLSPRSWLIEHTHFLQEDIVSYPGQFLSCGCVFDLFCAVAHVSPQWTCFIKSERRDSVSSVCLLIADIKVLIKAFHNKIV